MKRCPFCAELIKEEAIVCKHCGSRISLETREAGREAALSTSTNGLAVAAMICGLLWIWGLGALLGLIFGYTARAQIKHSGGTQVGGGMAMAGIVLGWIGMAVLVMIIVSVAALGS